MKKALFVTFEGVEGSGKSSQIANVFEYFTQKKLRVIQTREPGGTPLAEKIRELIIHQNEEPLSLRAEVLLMQAARAQHVDQLIQKNLHAVDLILCDRYTDSTIAYQGGGRKMDADWLKQLNKFSTASISPDVTFLMDLKIADSQNRIQVRKKRTSPQHTDRFEIENTDFHENIRETYLNLAKQEPNRIVLLNAMEKPQHILKIIVTEIEKRLTQ